MTDVTLPIGASNSGTNDWSDVHGEDQAIVDVVNGEITNSNIKSTAAIAYSKLAAASTGQVLIGNAGVPTMTTLTGDVTVGATGVTAIGSSKVTNAMMADNAINTDELVAGGVTDAKLASPNNGAYKVIAALNAYAGGFATGTYFLNSTTLSASGTGSAAAWPAGLVYINASDYAVTGLTTKLRVETVVSVGSTSPSTVTFATGLYPLTISGGNYTLGAVAVAGTTSFGLSTNSVFNFGGSDTTIPANGVYALGVTIGSITCPAGISVQAVLRVRNV